MSNLKKILALVLALVMSFSLVSVSSAAFKDEANITDVYAESADVLATLGVFKGYEDGSFNPKGSITRAEVAAIIYRVATGDVTDKQVGIYADYNVFSDVKSDAWYAGYVNYCANAQYIKGYGNGKFGPNDTVTGYQALAMILRAVGYDKNGEFTGPSWQVETAKIGNQLKITRNVNAGLLGTAATREVVAEILFRAINVPTVTYTLALGYNQYQETVVVNGKKTYNETLGQLNFGLEKRTGTLTGFTYETGAIELNGVAKNIINVAAGIEDVGYAGYVYTVPTAGKKTETAVSDFYKTGVELLNSNDGTSFTTLSPKYVTLDTGVEYFINGYTVEDYFETLGFFGMRQPTKAELIAAAQAMVAETGVKVSFIDNDNGGKAEVVAINHYTPAQVTAITNDYNTGINGVQANSYYLDHMAVKATDLITADDLAYGDWTTYVEYRGNYYVDEVDYVTGKFEYLGRVFVVDSNAYNAVYTVGGAEYYTADDYVITGTDALVKANLNKTVVLGLDPYGHVLSSALYADPAAFLYVVANEQTKQLTALTETMVAFSDGTIATVNVAYVDSPYNYYFQASDEATLQRAIPNHIYAYTVDEDGNYVLTTVACGDETLNYTAGLAQFGTKGLNNKSVVVDLRAKYLGNVYVGHTGENAVPSLTGAVVHYVVDTNGIVKLAYLLAGTNSVSLADEFVVFDTTWTDVKRVNSTTYVYYLDVLVDGVLVEDYELSQNEYEAVEKFGVGFYQFSKTGALTYTAFPEVWVDATWGANTLKVDTNNDGIFEYYAYGDIPFQVINVGSASTTPYLMNLGVDGYSVKVKAIPVWNTYGTAVIEMYVIADCNNLADAGDKYYKHTVTQTKNGVTYTYAVADLAITDVVTEQIVDLDAALQNAVDELDAAIAEYNKIAQALIDAGYTGITLMAADEVDVEELLAQLEAALAKVEAALNTVKKMVDAAPEKVTAAQQAKVNYVTSVAQQIVDNAAEVVKTVGAQDLDALFKAGFTYTIEADTCLATGLVYALTEDAEVAAALELFFADAEGDLETTVTLAEDAVMPEAGKTGDVEFTVEFKVGEKTYTKESVVTVTVKAKDATTAK